MLYGLTLEQVKFYLDFLPYLESCYSNTECMGNKDYDSYQTFSTLINLYFNHKEAVDSIFHDYDIQQMYTENLKNDIKLNGQFIDQMYYTLISNLVGYPVEYKDRIARVYDSHKIFFLKEEVVIPPLKEVKIK